MIGWFATSRIVKLGKATKEESAKNVSGRVALVSLYPICRCIVIFLAIFSDSLGIGEVLSAQRPVIVSDADSQAVHIWAHFVSMV
jgi:hypothetical protein